MPRPVPPIPPPPDPWPAPGRPRREPAFVPEADADHGDLVRGVCNGLLLALPFWLALGWLVWAWVHGAWPWGAG